MAAWMAAVSSVAPLPMAPKLRTLTTALPIDTVGVKLHQLVAEAGSATVASAKEMASDVKILLREMKGREFPDLRAKRPSAPDGAGLVYMELAPVLFCF
ncbi:hypothetical protein GCM10007898_09220 [Dyella flagellata]|uniref:Uncharacterized protein n=1 Tax=Dyella flagellata TaxID=1867833 RepID=A0ABQ5X6W2_9GAMM|nr:hypothetical protein GCM10007898_09220 [Dyella flagellata]